MEHSLREKIVLRIDNIRRYFLRRSVERIKDPTTRLEKQLMIEIKGTALGGMAASGAYTAFKEFYYNKLPSDNEKRRVQQVLLSILRSPKYSLREKALTAYVCADIQVEAAVDEIKKLLQRAKKNSIEEGEFKSSLEALKIGRPISEVIMQRLRERGDL